MKHSILVIDDEKGIRVSIESLPCDEMWDVRTADNGDAGAACLPGAAVSAQIS